MPVNAAKKASAPSVKKVGAEPISRSVKKDVELKAIHEWIEKNDPLIDYAPENPIPIHALFTDKLGHKSFAKPGMGEVPYDWSVFRGVLEARTASSPRWFVQLREEDLLAGDGLEGVSVDCFVIAEASTPTLSPAEYVVKVHWPYSDAEDNAPERILPISGQDMCWRRVVKSDGSDINVFLLQKRSSGTSAASSASFGFGASTASSTAAPPAVTPGFGFGAAPAAPAAGGFSFGFGNQQPSTTAAPAAGGFNFGFGTAAAPSNGGSAPAASFGFGAPTAVAPPTTAAPAAGFSFGGSASSADESAVSVQQLKTSEVLFCLWSRERLQEMVEDIQSGSRIVREGFPLDAKTNIKLVMQNDREDDVVVTVRGLILNRLFAKQDEEVREMDDWIGKCPVYDEELAPALQDFRERYVNEIADESDDFKVLYNNYSGIMTRELERIMAIREKAAQKELKAIEGILENIDDGKLSEKKSFRLLKYYAKNDVQTFRPFGKISGISEMGESVDVCVPPAHVNINPFTKQPM